MSTIETCENSYNLAARQTNRVAQYPGVVPRSYLVISQSKHSLRYQNNTEKPLLPTYRQ